jgi:hypothetical protein
VVGHLSIGRVTLPQSTQAMLADAVASVMSLRWLGWRHIAKSLREVGTDTLKVCLNESPSEIRLLFFAINRDWPYCMRDLLQPLITIQIGVQLIAGQFATIKAVVDTGSQIYISNEETSDQVLSRLACLQLKIDPNAYIEGRLKDLGAQDSIVRERKMALISQVHVISGTSVRGQDMRCLEDVKNLLLKVERMNFDMIILDYFQTVNMSRKIREDSYARTAILKSLGDFLKEYTKNIPVPVILFAQLRPNSSSSRTVEPFGERVQSDRALANHGHCLIEVLLDKQSLTTSFIIHKDRYGVKQGLEIEAVLKNGRYVPFSFDEQMLPPTKPRSIS